VAFAQVNLLEVIVDPEWKDAIVLTTGSQTTAHAVALGDKMMSSFPELLTVQRAVRSDSFSKLWTSLDEFQEKS
jgi:hypothetical protein